MIVAAFRGEVFKQLRRPAVRVTIIILLVLAVGLGYVLTWFIANHPPPATGRRGGGLTPADVAALKRGLHPASLVKQTLGGWASLGGVFALILGVLSQGSEYGWETVKTMYTQWPGRLTMLAGKLATLFLTVLVLALSLFAANAIASYSITSIDGGPLAFPPVVDLMKGLGAIVLVFSFWAMFGLGLATLFRQSAMAIGLGLAYGLVIENLVFGLLAGLNSDTIKTIQEWFPISNAGYLVASFGASASGGGPPSAPPLADGPHAALVLVLWVAALVAGTALLVRRRDVN
ncbi:MAG: type transport system permease protein [Chloroflexota bacterium]|nr:type transport system permease protein [Chloroflexota bacterium]